KKDLESTFSFAFSLIKITQSKSNYLLYKNEMLKKILNKTSGQEFFRYLRFHILSIFLFNIFLFFSEFIFKSWNNAEFKCLFLYFFSIV
ncbi:hypothetical protein ACJX0J_002322, partial [Zea mays]